MAEQALFMMCEFWAAVVAGELDAHWRSGDDERVQAVITICAADPLPAEPAAAVAGVAAWIEREVGAAVPRELTLIGSSLGGYYATHLAERFGARAVLINPAVRPYDDLVQWRGLQRNLYTGEAFEVVDAHFARVTRPERYFLLLRTGDEVLDWREAVAFYAGARQYLLGGGDHGWTDFDAEIPAVLRFAEIAIG